MSENETMHWADTGCEVSASCFECPLPQCRWDDPYAFQRYRRQAQDAAIAQDVRVLGMAIAEASAKYRITERTVFRAIERYLKEGAIA